MEGEEREGKEKKRGGKERKAKEEIRVGKERKERTKGGKVRQGSK